MLKNKIKLSVILAVRNESNSITSCINSICQQQFNHTFEILLIDGLSEDGTIEVAELAFKNNNFTFFKILKNDLKHVANGLNVGIENAKGEFLCRVDGRFELSKNYFQSCYDCLTNKKCDVIGGKLISKSKNFTSIILANVLSSKYGVGWGNFRTMTKGSELIELDTVTGVFGRAIIFKEFLYDTYFVRSQDEELNFRFRKKGLKVCLNTSISITYEIRSSLKTIIFQYFQYGYWKFKVSIKHKKVIVSRQLVPLIFLFYIIFSPFLILESIFFCIPFFIYLLIPFSISEKKYYLSTLLILFLIHTSYGFGSLLSLTGIRVPNLVQRLTR